MRRTKKPYMADVDRVETGPQRSGMCYGVWWLVTKISEALALAAVSYILTGFGYWTNIEQSDRALLGIRLFFGLVSSVFFFLSVPLLFRYSITRKSHAEIRRCLEAIETVGAAGDDELVRTL